MFENLVDAFDLRHERVNKILFAGRTTFRKPLTKINTQSNFKTFENICVRLNVNLTFNSIVGSVNCRMIANPVTKFRKIRSRKRSRLKIVRSLTLTYRILCPKLGESI